MTCEDAEDRSECLTNKFTVLIFICSVRRIALLTLYFYRHLNSNALINFFDIFTQNMKLSNCLINN